MIPFFPPDLFQADRDTLVEIVHRVGCGPQQRFILGDCTARFEEALATSLGARDVIACGSGTSALTLVLSALEVGPGDEVVVPAFGCAPLASSVVNLGATPVFADIDALTMVADAAEMEALVTDRTSAIMPAHMFSVMADMPRMREIAARRHVHLVEDSAVAQGALLDGRPAGRWGEAGVFSFVQVKTFGTAGEGGVVVTDDPDIGRIVRMLRNHGQDGTNRFLHHRVGYNSRFDEVLAAFQLYRLPGLPDRLERRAHIAAYYNERFAPLGDDGIVCPPGGRNGRCYYVYSLLAARRDELKQHLATQGVACHVYYPVPLPRQPAFSRFAGERKHWPNAEQASRTALAIPVYPHLSDAEVEHIADAVCGFVSARSLPAPQPARAP